MHFKWVNYMVFALNFNKAVFFFLKATMEKGNCISPSGDIQ